MNKKISLRITALLLTAVCLLPAVFCACDETVTIDGATLLSFKSAASYDYLKTLDGKKVTIKGWLATSSPVDGSFIFLMNMPYQSCPFCKPNTNQLSNTMEVYPRKGKTFEYTAEVVQVVGTLAVAPVNSPYTDKYGYEFNYKIVDAEYFFVDESELSPELVLWQKVANSDIVSDVYKMFDYLNFVCKWGTYTYEFKNGKDYLYPSDAEKFIKTDGAQFNYGYKDGYFEGLILKVRNIDKDKLEDLVTVINKGKELATKALSELESENYSVVSEYSRNSSGELIFGNGRSQYKMNDESLVTDFESIYQEFYSWFSGWEL